jgi:putative hemolysin
MIFFEILILVFLFLASAFFSASEAALTSLSSLKMKQLAVVHPALGRHLNEWLSRPHRILVTILVGNNAVNVAISSLGATLILPAILSLPKIMVEVILWLATSVLLLVVGEIVPKIVGRVYAERVSVWTFPILGRLTRAFSLFFRPAHNFLDRFAGGVESAPVNKLTALSLEEMHHIINESQASGHVSTESGAMMDRVLALNRRTVADILQPASSIDTVAMELLDRADNNAELFVDLLVESGHSRVPVTRAGVPVGIVHVMDLLKEWRSGRVGSLEALIRPVFWVSPAKSASDLLADFQKTGDHAALAEGEHGEFVGMVTLEDLLEEIVGEIVDEYDLEQKKEP